VSRREQGRRDRHGPRPQVFAEALGLRIRPGGGGHAGRDQAGDDEVDRAQVGQFVAADLQAGGLGQQLAEQVDGEFLAKPCVRAVVARPEADVGVAALVAGTGADEPSERHTLAPAVEGQIRRSYGEWTFRRPAGRVRNVHHRPVR
jgi:hypothetical protein